MTSPAAEAIEYARTEYGEESDMFKRVLAIHKPVPPEPVTAAELDLADWEELQSTTGPIRLADITEVQPLGYQTDGLLIANDVNGVVGGGGSGKTSLLIHLGVATVTGSAAFGVRATMPGTVLFVTGEDDRHVILNRATAMTSGHQWEMARTLENFYVWDEGVDLDDPKCQARILDFTHTIKPVLSIFDPLIDLCGHGIEENSNSDAKRVTGFLRRLAREGGTTPVLAMHTAKAAEGKTREDRVRGASAWRNATRLCWWVEPCDGGLEMDPIKSNRSRKPKLLRVRQTIATQDNNELMWKAAHFSIDESGEVVHASVLKMLRYVAGCVTPPSVRDAEAAESEHGLKRDTARQALAIGKARGWIQAVEGPRKALLHTITEPGQARLLLG